MPFYNHHFGVSGPKSCSFGIALRRATGHSERHSKIATCLLGSSQAFLQERGLNAATTELGQNCCSKEASHPVLRNNEPSRAAHHFSANEGAEAESVLMRGPRLEEVEELGSLVTKKHLRKNC